MTIRFIRAFALAAFLLTGTAANAALLSLDYVAEISDIDGSAAAIAALAAAGIVQGTDARGTVDITDAVADSAPGDSALGVYVGAVTGLTLRLDGVDASFDGNFNDVYVNDDSADILLATGAMTYGNAGLGGGLVGLQLRDSSGGAWSSDAIPLDYMFDLNDLDVYVPFDAEGTGLLLSMTVGGELVTVFAEIKTLQAKVVPLPAAVWMLGFALLTLGGFTRRRHG